MIDSKEFAAGMLLESEQASLDYALERERESLWFLWGEVEEITMIAGQQEVVVANDTVEVSLVAFERTLLTRVKEGVLDAVNHNWRSAANDTPRNWLYKGEEDLQTLRIYPPPAVAGSLQVIKNVLLPLGAARWHNVLLGLGIFNRMSIIDPLRARPKEGDFCDQLFKLILRPMGIMQ
jgi:hypothetical protein